MDYHALGKRIREERLRLNLTQEKLAEEVGVSTAYIGTLTMYKSYKNSHT